MIDAVESQLEAREADFVRAVSTNDADALREIVHADWEIVESGGRSIDGSKFLALVESGDLVHTRMETSEVRVRRYGDTAIVTGRATTEGRFRGDPFHLRERFNDVFVREGGRWRCVLTQLTAIAGDHDGATTGERVHAEAAGSRPSRDSTVNLRAIDENSVRAICQLAVTKAQEEFVAPNAVSLAQASFSDRAWYRAIYADETPVGFVMLSVDEAKPEYYLWRYMIDARYQGHGFGARALGQVIDHVRGLPGAKTLLTSIVEGPGSPRGFYERLGFVLTGEYEDDEAVMRLAL